MSELLGISPRKRLTSQPRASLIQEQRKVEKGGMKEIKELEIEMEQLKHAFTLVKEIEQGLEAMLLALSPARD